MERTLTFSVLGSWHLNTVEVKCITLEGNYIEKEAVDLNRKQARLVTY